MSLFCHDIEFVVPVSTHGHFADRLTDFVNYGLLNMADKRVLVTFLAGTHKLPSIALANANHRIVAHAVDHPAPKIYSFFSRLDRSHAARVRWLAKVDDDSVTNVAGLVDQLDQEYDYTKDCYLLADASFSFLPQYWNLLSFIGAKNISTPRRTNHPKFQAITEWECSIFSQSALRSLVSCAPAMQFLQRASEHPSGYGDQCTALAARIAKIPICDVPFMTKDPAVEEFSLFGGRFHHLHFLARDKGWIWKRFQTVLEMHPSCDLSAKLSDEDRMLFMCIAEKSAKLYRNNGEFIADIKLLRDGRLQACNANESYWEIVDKTLVFRDIRGAITTLFDKYDAIAGRFTGSFRPNPNVRHTLVLL